MSGLEKTQVFTVNDINGVKLLSRLRLDFSHLNEHRFQHNFNDIINPMCSCGKEPETTFHYLLHCDLYSIYRLELRTDICVFSESLNNFSEENLLKFLLYGPEDFTSQIDSKILKCTMFIKKTDPFSGPLFYS